MKAVAGLAPIARTQEGELLLEPLLQWLVGTQRLRAEGGLYLELPWSGRRIDVVTVGKRLRTAAFELKLGRTGRALEQAIYNRAAFDRSYMVLGHLPSQTMLDEAACHGIGVLVVEQSGARLVVESPLEQPSPAVRKRLLSSLRTRPAWSGCCESL